MRLPSILVNFAIGAVLLALVLSAVDASVVSSAFARADWRFAGAALLLVQAQILLSALRWRFTAGRLGNPLPLRSALAWYYEASLLNLVLPAGVLGDGFRAYRARAAGGIGGALRAVVFERLSGQAAFFLLALSGLWLWPALLRSRVPETIQSAALLAFGVLAAACALAVAAAIRRRLSESLARLRRELRAVFLARGAWLVQSALSLTIALSYVAVFALSAAALGKPLPAAAWVTVVPLVLLTMLVPVSVGGWGVREAASAALWPVIGQSAAQGVAVALLYGLIVLAGSLPGAVSMVVARSSPGADAPPADRRA